VEMPGGWELVLVLLVIVVVFGSKRMPDTARSLGRSMRILKTETQGTHDDDPPPAAAAVFSPGAGAQPIGGQLFDAQGRPVSLPARAPQASPPS